MHRGSARFSPEDDHNGESRRHVSSSAEQAAGAVSSTASPPTAPAQPTARKCAHCPAPALPGISRCQTCRDRVSARNKTAYKKRKAAGLCSHGCGRPARPGRTTCELHKTPTDQWKQRKAAGLCSRCGARPPVPGRQHCEPCRKAHGAYARRWAQRKRDGCTIKRQCWDCGAVVWCDEKRRHGRVTCGFCYLRRMPADPDAGMKVAATVDGRELYRLGRPVQTNAPA